MAQLPGAFDATNVDTTDQFDVIDPGDYTVQVVQSEIRVTKAGTGQYIWLELDILDGQYQGRKLWDNVNIINPNPKAQQIGEKILAQICKACNLGGVTDSEQFHFKPMTAKVTVQPASGQYGPSNQVKSYKAVDGTAVARQDPQISAAAPQSVGEAMPAAQAQPAAGGAAAMPWNRA